MRNKASKIPVISNDVYDKIKRIRSVIRCNNGNCWEGVIEDTYNNLWDKKRNFVEFIKKYNKDIANGITLYLALEYQNKEFMDNLEIRDIEINGLEKKLVGTYKKIIRENPEIYELIKLMNIMSNNEKKREIRMDILLSYVFIDENFKEQYNKIISV